MLWLARGPSSAKEAFPRRAVGAWSGRRLPSIAPLGVLKRVCGGGGLLLYIQRRYVHYSGILLWSVFDPNTFNDHDKITEHNVFEFSIAQSTLYIASHVPSCRCGSFLRILPSRTLAFTKDWPILRSGKQHPTSLSVSECAGRTSHGPVAGSGDVTSGGGFARHNFTDWDARRSCQVPLAQISGPKYCLLSIPSERIILGVFIVFRSKGDRNRNSDASLTTLRILLRFE